MATRKHIPVALTIAGSDSGGGAGIQADLKTFAALDVHGVSVITCITAQNPRQIRAAEPCRASLVQRQLEAVFDELPPAAVKTGMLCTARLVRAVADGLRRRAQRPLVVDPVLVSTSGAPLLQPAALRVLVAELLPLATLVTPNVPEAERLLGEKLESVEDLRRAAKAFHARFGCAALVKGGHLPDLEEAVDIFYDGQQEWLLRAPFVRGVRTHGTGCTYSAAVTAYLARRVPLARAVQQAKQDITQAIAQCRLAAGHPVLDTLAIARRCSLVLRNSTSRP